MHVKWQRWTLWMFLAIAACGAPQPHVPERPETVEEAPADEAAVQEPLVESPTALVVPAMSHGELRALADRLTLEEVMSPAFVADRAIVPLQGQRFFVYEDLGDLGLGHRCLGLGGSSEGEELMVEVLGPRERDGQRSFHEIIFRGGILETAGGSRGPQGVSAMGGINQLGYAVVRSDADHRVYSTSAEIRDLACGPAARTVECPGGGVSACRVLLPEVTSSAGVPNAVYGEERIAVLTGGVCELACAHNECEEAIGQLRSIRTVYRQEGAVIAVFRSRRSCRAFARERAPILDRVRAERGDCDCRRCPSDDEDCNHECQRTCAESHQNIIDAHEPEAPPPSRRFSHADVQVTEAPDRVQYSSAAQLADSLRSCVEDALEELDPEHFIDGTVAREPVTWTVGTEGRITRVERTMSRSPTHLTGDCLDSVRDQAFRAGQEPTTFQTTLRIVVGPSASD